MKHHPKLFLLFLICFLLAFIQGCASSDISRGSASEADKAYLDADYALNHPDGSLSDAYQNSTQTTKGVVFGGAVGAGVGSLNTSIGVLPGLAIGAIFGGALGAYIDSHTTLTDKLENRGVKVIVLGDQILIVIPSVLVFDDMTSNIRSHAYSTLDLVAAYINKNPNMSVNVAAYTSACGSPEAVNLALTQQQATAVAKYLWSQGVNTRLLSTSGYGGANLIAANKPDWNSDNFRVEITLEKLPV